MLTGWRYDAQNSEATSKGARMMARGPAVDRNFRPPASKASERVGDEGHERIFTTTSRDADMAGDEPGGQREWTRAGAGRLQDKSSKLADSRQVHKHR